MVYYPHNMEDLVDGFTRLDQEPIKNWRATQERVEKFISEVYFTDVNLRGRLAALYGYCVSYRTNYNNIIPLACVTNALFRFGMCY